MAEKKMEELELPEVNMYILFARLFAHITKEVEDACGEKGVEAIRKAVSEFGEERGRDIAARAAAKGYDTTPEHYLSCYDMGRSGFFHSSDDVSAKRVEQDFDRCVFAETWMKDGTEKYGIHYCQMIDPAIARGYNKDFECIHDKHFFKDGGCHFVFKMKDEK